MSSRRNVFFNTRTSEPLPACAHSTRHLRTSSGTVLRNLPSVQGFVSAQVLQRALTAAPRRSNVHSGTLTHNPKHQQQPAPSSSNPFIGPVLRYTFLPFSPFSSAFPLQMHELLAFPNELIFLPHLAPGTPPPFLSLAAPTFLPLLSRGPKAIKSDPSGLRCSRKAHYSSAPSQPFLRKKLSKL